jgi:hypothetical protein
MVRDVAANGHASLRLNTMTTSKSDGSKASKLLSTPSTPKTVKSVAGSDLAGRKGHKPGK